MKMTRQDFQAQADLCADIIAEMGLGTLSAKTNSILDSFCDMCARSNPSFDRARFATWVFNNLDGIKNK
tara:strand:+ start:885 stop:1091 length:207 start_codon:yes stop_codon:yes gene_type:complete